MRRGIRRCAIAAGLVTFFAVAAVALAGGNVMDIKLPKQIPEEGYFNYTLTGRFDVKDAKTVDVWAYESMTPCKDSLKNEIGYSKPYVVKAKGTFKLKPTLLIGPRETIIACAYADYVHDGHREKVASASAKAKSPAT